MDYYQTIARNFRETIEAITANVDPLAPALEQTSQLMSAALVSDKKIMACGNGTSNALAQLFVTNLLNRFEQERPGLPAMSLCNDAATLTGIASAYTMAEIYSKQIRALGQAGDLLVCIANGEGNGSIIQAVRAAHERDMIVIVLCADNCSDISSLLLPEDLELNVASSRMPRIAELHTMLIHCICELVDHTLFGGFDT